MDGWKTRGAALVWRHLAPQRMRIGYLRFLFFFFLFLFNFSPRFVLSFPRCAVLNHFTAYNVCKITSEMMYRHGMVFTSDRSSGIGCSRPRRRVFVVHEISGTPLRVRVSSKIFIVFLSLSLSLYQANFVDFIRSLRISLTARSAFLYSRPNISMLYLCNWNWQEIVKLGENSIGRNM